MANNSKRAQNKDESQTCLSIEKIYAGSRVAAEAEYDDAVRRAKQEYDQEVAIAANAALVKYIERQRDAFVVLRRRDAEANATRVESLNAIGCEQVRRIVREELTRRRRQ